MGIILLFQLAAALVACLIATGLAGGLIMVTLQLMSEHPAWRWPGAALLLGYGGLMLSRYRQPGGGNADVPEGLRELQADVDGLVRLWPLPPAVVAIAGAVVVLSVRW